MENGKIIIIGVSGRFSIFSDLCLTCMYYKPYTQGMLKVTRAFAIEQSVVEDIIEEALDKRVPQGEIIKRAMEAYHRQNGVAPSDPVDEAEIE